MDPVALLDATTYISDPNFIDIFLTSNFTDTSSPEFCQQNKISMASACVTFGCSAVVEESAMIQTSFATPTYY